MVGELHALTKTHTWDFVNLPPSKTIVCCKWVYKIKNYYNASIECYKARLVARGYTQEYGIEYEKTFAPVAHVTSVQSLLVFARVHK